jgi:hypothetical protein
MGQHLYILYEIPASAVAATIPDLIQKAGIGTLHGCEPRRSRCRLPLRILLESHAANLPRAASSQAVIIARTVAREFLESGRAIATMP